MPKREAERLASEIWAFKDETDAVAPIALAEATAVFLERRFFAIPRLVTEVCHAHEHPAGGVLQCYSLPAQMLLLYRIGQCCLHPTNTRGRKVLPVAAVRLLP